MTADDTTWVVCQIGGRENYAIARALARRQALAALLTDAWAPSGAGAPALMRHRFAQRRHPELSRARVEAPTVASLWREARDRVRGLSGWRQIMRRNAWFADWAAGRLARIAAERPGRPQTVFAYSYAAGEIFRVAKARGATTVLGQIDPGPAEARLVAELHASAGRSAGHERIPDAYWDRWREETQLADVVVVNSEWSREGLVGEGVPASKIRVVPLAYEPQGDPVPAPSPSPARFTADRPLRVLFLGQVTLRKGIEQIFAAMELLQGAPITLDIVGPVQAGIPPAIRSDPRVTLHGPVSRHAVQAFYRRADVFLFPTLSDGFGLTQLEALAAGVPVIASRRCGEVVEPGRNGTVLETVDGPSIAGALSALVARPERLAEWRRGARLDARFSLDALGRSLAMIAGAGVS